MEAQDCCIEEAAANPFFGLICLNENIVTRLLLEVGFLQLNLLQRSRHSLNFTASRSLARSRQSCIGSKHCSSLFPQLAVREFTVGQVVKVFTGMQMKLLFVFVSFDDISQSHNGLSQRRVKYQPEEGSCHLMSQTCSSAPSELPQRQTRTRMRFFFSAG